MVANRTRPRCSGSALRTHVRALSLLLFFGACTHHPMLQKPSDAGQDGIADQPDVAIDQAPRAPDAGIDTGGGGDVATWADGPWAGDTWGGDEASAWVDGSGLDLVPGVDATDLAPATVPIRSQKLEDDTGLNFGRMVAVSGDALAIASGYRVLFFKRTSAGWTPSTVFGIPSTSNISSLAMDGDLAAVGVVSLAKGTLGAVHTLRKSGDAWNMEDRIYDPTSDAGGMFGCSVAVSAGTIVVGAERNYDGKPGSAYVFVKGSSGWEQQATLEGSSDGTPATELANDKFGRSVAISADAIAVSRPMGKHPGVLLFRRQAGVWQRDPRFQPDTALFDQPLSVALDGDSMLIGDNGREVGFVYRNGGAAGWALEDKLTARPQSNLGYSVALTGRLAVTGGLSPGDRSDHGNAYAFVRSQVGWSAPIPLLPEGESPPAGFGSPVAASGSTIVVGALFATKGGIEAGAAYVFDLDLSGVP